MEKKIQELYNYLHGPIRSHKDWAESFNMKGEIRRILNAL